MRDLPHDYRRGSRGLPIDARGHANEVICPGKRTGTPTLAAKTPLASACVSALAARCRNVVSKTTSMWTLAPGTVRPTTRISGVLIPSLCGRSGPEESPASVHRSQEKVISGLASGMLDSQPQTRLGSACDRRAGPKWSWRVDHSKPVTCSADTELMILCDFELHFRGGRNSRCGVTDVIPSRLDATRRAQLQSPPSGEDRRRPGYMSEKQLLSRTEVRRPICLR